MTKTVIFTWVRDEFRDADNEVWVPANSWISYIEDPSEEDDYSMNYASIEKLEDGKFLAEVGSCGMRGGKIASNLADTFELATNEAELLFVQHVIREDVTISSYVMPEGAVSL